MHSKIQTSLVKHQSTTCDSMEGFFKYVAIDPF
jgi:hypothetical protein